ncbi:unnamed protein product [Strongylus vulgaris]|uniref:Uncharacterized protein n=1 Tax=Strongylus vulgaris TaxID=40348 RepID=A0A3P7KI51_STRVU|nr:unnamed protein product [Strongylus vulgaris]
MATTVMDTHIMDTPTTVIPHTTVTVTMAREKLDLDLLNSNSHSNIRCSKCSKCSNHNNNCIKKNLIKIML